MIKSIRVYFAGRVQGVGFRYRTRKFARTLGIDGWVRNLPDGRVELHAEGKSEELEELLSELDRFFIITEREIKEVEPEEEPPTPEPQELSFDDFAQG